MNDPPAFLSIDACIGMHASASTFVFNAARELREAAAPQATISLYQEDVAKLAAQPDKRLVLKSHHGGADLDAWLLAQGATLLLSVRDPRDAAVSMSRRFGAPLRQAAVWIARDGERLLRLRPHARAWLAYEQRFFERPQTVVELAGLMQVSAAPADAIFDRYRTQAVKAFSEALDRLPPERTQAVSGWRMDKLTQIHAPHIGDGAVGKWRALPGPEKQWLRSYFHELVAALGYPA